MKLLKEYGCREVILIQPEKRSKKKTDRRDANALGEILWVNRRRLLEGRSVQGVHCVEDFPGLPVLTDRLAVRRGTIEGLGHKLLNHNDIETPQEAREGLVNSAGCEKRPRIPLKLVC
jgi:hypothetical protein